MENQPEVVADEQPLIMKQDSNSEDQQPSDNWSAFSDSVLSTRHITEKDKLIRTSDHILTSANISKLYVGIAFISVSKSIS